MIREIFQLWLEPSDEVQALEHVETDTVADRERVGYRLSVTNPDGRFVVEQQAYLAERDGRIGWMRVALLGVPARGLSDELAARADAELRVDARQVDLDGLGAHQQLGATSRGSN